MEKKQEEKLISKAYVLFFWGWSWRHAHLETTRLHFFFWYAKGVSIKESPPFPSIAHCVHFSPPTKDEKYKEVKGTSLKEQQTR